MTEDTISNGVKIKQKIARAAAIEAALLFLAVATTFFLIAAASALFSNTDILRIQARGLLDGKFYDSIKPERENVDEYIKIMPRPDIAVLGSSRMLPISSASFPGYRFVNLAMSNASVEDSVATYNLLFENNKLPRLVIITFEDWVFNRNNKLKEWKEWGGRLDRAIERTGAEKRPVPCATKTILACLDEMNAFLGRFNPRNLQRAIKLSLQNGHLVTAEEIAALSEVDNALTVGWQPDRSYQYGSRGKDYVDDNVLKWKREAGINESYNKLYYSDFTELYGLAFENIGKLFIRMRQDGVRVLLFFPPMHPDAYEAMFSYPQGRLALAAEEKLKSLAHEAGIGTMGSNDPNDCGARREGFVDAIHLRLEPMAACMDRYSDAIKKTLGTENSTGQ
ncbi:MAG: hypothetical protein HZA67_13475 [Rhodospirillales bacterium]|nr:hypothetical protein [Rhodospirillales bacterium]